MNVVLIGYPGAGKGTQAEKLNEEYDFKHVSTGDLIRREIAQGTQLGRKIEALIKAGNLASDEDTINLLRNDLTGFKGNVVFDGFPRTLSQAEALDYYVERVDERVDAVVLIDLCEEEVLKRLTSRRVCKLCGAIYNIYSPDFKNECLKCGGELVTRPDDSLESAKHRLEVFKEETAPLLNYYGKTTGVKKVNGSGTIDEVFLEIVNALGLKK